MRITIKDIAREAGVSVTTVSLVLNNKPNTIAKTTKERIIKLAKELNYRPNHMAVSLVTKQSKMIGLVVPDISNNFFADLAKNIESSCEVEGYSLILANANNSLTETQKYVNHFISRGVDGLILAFYTDEEENTKKKIIENLNKYEIPIVTVDSWINGLVRPGVSVHHAEGGYIATKHLLDLGHTKIACITGTNGNYSSDRRLKGYTRALNEANISVNPLYLVEGNYQYQGGYKAAKEILKQDITALFVCNDLMAYGAYTAVKEAGLNIPEDISIVGFDDLLFSKMLSVPLTTVHQEIDQLGSKATELLLDYIKNGKPKKDFYRLEPSLVIRESTATLRKKGNES